MDIDIFCKNDKCPICQSAVVREDILNEKLDVSVPVRYLIVTCENECYSYGQIIKNYTDPSKEIFKVFQEIFQLALYVEDQKSKEKLYSAVRDRVTYLATNEQYVAELMCSKLKKENHIIR